MYITPKVNAELLCHKFSDRTRVRQTKNTDIFEGSKYYRLP